MNLIAYDGQIELEEDDWRDDCEPSDNDEEGDYYDEDDEWECAFGEHCLMPSFLHRRSECYTVEMAEAWEESDNPLCVCNHRLNTHNPCCVSACGCDGFVSADKPLTDAQVDALMSAEAPPACFPWESGERLWAELEARQPESADATRGASEGGEG